MKTASQLFNVSHGLVVTLALAGCSLQPFAATTVSRFGSAHVMLNTLDTRSVQYVAGDIKAIHVAVMTSLNGGPYASSAAADFTGSTLASHLSNNVFSVTVDNLKVTDTVSTYSYEVTSTAYLETAETTNLGSSTSSPFSVTTSQAPLSVTMPSIKLLATPVGSASAGVTIVDNPAPAVVIR